MGKKGKKKKEKVTGTPDVVKFKGHREFQTLKEAVAIQESLPFVNNDILNEMDMKKVARFLNMLGLLAEYTKAAGGKEYRFRLHHRLLYPAPQYYPYGYPASIVTEARAVVDKPFLTFNGKDYPLSEELRNKSDMFLKNVDSYMTSIAGFIEPNMKDDFAMGLKKFKSMLREKLHSFDESWRKYEEEFMQALLSVHSEVFTPCDKLVSLEERLTRAEEQNDIENKQRYENELVSALEEFTNLLYPDTADSKFPDEVIPLAEACCFYESKCSDEWLNLAKHLIKSYLEMRIYITNIPQSRLYPQLHDNARFVLLLKAFHKSVFDAYEALEFVAKLPRLIHTKIDGWMSKSLLEPEVREMKDGGWSQWQTDQGQQQQPRR